MSDVPPFLGPILNFGVLGIGFMALMVGAAVPGWLYKQMRAERDQARAETAELRMRMDEKTIPMLQQVAQVLGEAVRALDTKARR